MIKEKQCQTCGRISNARRQVLITTDNEENVEVDLLICNRCFERIKAILAVLTA